MTTALPHEALHLVGVDYLVVVVVVPVSDDDAVLRSAKAW